MWKFVVLTALYFALNPWLQSRAKRSEVVSDSCPYPPAPCVMFFSPLLQGPSLLQGQSFVSAELRLLHEKTFPKHDPNNQEELRRARFVGIGTLVRRYCPSLPFLPLPIHSRLFRTIAVLTISLKRIDGICCSAGNALNVPSWGHFLGCQY